MADINITFPNQVALGGVTDHGALAGLGDDDHPQYAKRTGGSLVAATSISLVFPDGTVHRILPKKIGSMYTLDVDQSPES